MRIKRREVIEKAVRTQGVIALVSGGVLGFALFYFNSVWIFSALLVAAMIGLNYSFIRIVKYLEKELDNWDKLKEDKEKDIKT